MAMSIKKSLNIYRTICLMAVTFGIMLLLVSWPTTIRAQEALDEKKGSSPILVGRFENAGDSVSFWDERINH